MRKIRKSLAVFLAAIMLATFMPLFASAAVVTLSKGNCELVEAPKLSFNGGEPTSDLTVPFGITWGDISFVGGSIKYNGEVIDGYFDWYSSYLTRVPETGAQSRLMIYFYPTDTTNYKSGAWLTTATSPLEGWPTVTVSGKQAILEEAPTTLGGGLGAILRSVPLNGGKVTYEGTEITDGTWAWATPSTKLEAEGTFEYEAKWTCEGYDPIIVNIPVNVQQYKTVLAEAPTATKILSGYQLYRATLTGGKVTLEDGTDVTSLGYWEYVDLWSVPTESGEYEVQWKATGYDTISVNVYVEIEAIATKLLTPPTIPNVNMGTNKSFIDETDGVVVLDDGADTDITSLGRWTYVYPTGLKHFYQDTVVTAIWSATGYETIEYPITVKVNQSLEYNVVSPASFKEKNIIYQDGLTWENLEINKAVVTDKTTGAEIPGTYVYAQIESLEYASYWNYYTGQINATTYNVYIHFIPDDENLSGIGFYDTLSVEKLTFTLSDTFEIILNEGDAFDGEISGDELQFSNLDTEPAGVIINSVSWSKNTFDPQTAALGSTTMVSATIKPNSSYETITATIPVTIQKKVYTDNSWYLASSNLGVSGTKNEEYDGIKYYKIEFTNKKLKGSVDFIVNDEVIASASSDENGKFYAEGQWNIPASGEYTYRFEYKPSEEDLAIVRNPVVKKTTITVELRPIRTLTVKVGDEVYTFTDRVGNPVYFNWKQETDLSTEEFTSWVFTDDKGNTITLVNPDGEDITNTPSLYFFMPDYDVTATMKNQSSIGGDIIGGGDAGDGTENGIFGSIWAFFQKLINWFINIIKQMMSLFGLGA